MHLRAAFRNLLQLWLLPGLVALLPWRLGWALTRLAGRWPGLYKGHEAATLRGFAAAGFPPPDDGFLRRQRMVRLLDHADLFLSLTRSDRWIDRHIDIEGEWPREGHYVGVTFHWGGGLWGLRHFGRIGASPHAMTVELNPAHYRSQPFALAYDRLRNRETGRASKAQAFERGSALRHMLRALDRGENIFGAIDVPVTDARNAVEVELLGRRARFPTGLLQIARRAGVPVLPFWTGIDWATGRRRIVIRPPMSVDDLEAAARALAADLDPLIRQWPDQWHMWPAAVEILQPPAVPAPESPSTRTETSAPDAAVAAAGA